MANRSVVCCVTAFVFVFSGGSFCCGEEERDWSHRREAMVSSQIAARGIKDPRVIGAMEQVPRHRFVPDRYREQAYADHPLPIGHGQTISQPYIVAFMTEALQLRPDETVLEVGTGSGYQAAVLAEMARNVYTIEIVEALGERAIRILNELGYDNVHIRIGDGYKGWPDKAPFDAVIVTCAPDRIPQALVAQLKEGGRMIVPVGRAGGIQKLVRGIKTGGKLKTEEMMLVRFVPMVRGE